MIPRNQKPIKQTVQYGDQMFSSGFHLITEWLFPYSKITFQKYFWYMYTWFSEFLSIMTS